MRSRMVRLLCVAVLAFSMLTPTTALASSQNYSIFIPKYGDVWTDGYLLNYQKKFGAKLYYSGGKNIAMQMHRYDTRQALGTEVVMSPGGSGAPLKQLWYNNTATRYVVVRLNSVFGVVVDVIAQGTWYWNY